MPATGRSRAAVALPAAAITLSAFLLFLLEPLVAKRILPWFGGSAAVWSTCLVFYQVALLLGYLYARVLARALSVQRQALIHCVLLLVSLPGLPIGPGTAWQIADPAHPFFLIFRMLAATVGLPFVLLSATSPLLQHWLAVRSQADESARTPYWLFAVSNAASLAALFAYPLWIEPGFDIFAQRNAWSVLYSVFVLLCGTVAVGQRGTRAASRTATGNRVSVRERLLWLGLAACGSITLLAFTNHLTQNVAAVPLLWILPLALYLLTFVIAFGRRSWYRRSLFLRILALSLAAIAYAIWDIRAVEAIQISLPIFLAGLFAACLFCHGELSLRQPETVHLTEFYLYLAAGGAVGAILVGLVAPVVFGGIYELPLSLLFVALLAVGIVWREGWPMRLVWLGASAAMVCVLVLNVEGFHRDALVLRRSFYGSLRVVQDARITEHQTRSLFHGTIKHGDEFLSPALHLRPTTYYGPDSGIGILLRDCYPSPKHVGIVGLGAGTVAAYSDEGDTYHFFEINPQVVNIARGLFRFVPEAKGRVRIDVGDGRLLLAQGREQFDVLALDAFSGDAVPVHLLTEEALALYREHLRPGGTIAFHVSNNYLDLGAVVAQLARRVGMLSALVHNAPDVDSGVDAADWVLVTNNSAILQRSAIRVHQKAIASRAGLRPWTDSYNDLLDALRPLQVGP